LKSNKNDQLRSEKKTFYQENDNSSENVDKLWKTASKDVSSVVENSSSSGDLLCQINNIYMISNFNASAVKVGDSSFRNNSKNSTNNKSKTKNSLESECNTSEVKSAKIKTPVYFEKSGNMEKSTFILNFPTTVQTPEDNLEITYHSPTKTNV